MRGDQYVPDLVLRRADNGAEVSHALIHDWNTFFDAHKSRLYVNFHSPYSTHESAVVPAFRFLHRPDTVLLIQVPWLAVVNIHSGSIVRSVLPSPDLTDPKSPALQDPLGTPVPMVVSVSPGQGKVAVASNIGKGPRVSVFSSDLTRQIKGWTLPRYVKDIAWSPDGRRLVVLYDGFFDKKRNYVGELPQSKWPVSLADVETFNAMTGTVLVQCVTGQPEAEITFSPDGSLIYTISQQSHSGPLRGEGVRVFSATSGQLVRVMAPSSPLLYDEFALSPDGGFIAANASTPRWHPFFTEPVPPIFGNVTRLVVLDAKTGKVLFRHEKKTGVAFPLNPIFTPDGNSLIVQYGPERSARGSQRYLVHIVAYSLSGLATQ